jgi:hypothetical protein
MDKKHSENEELAYRISKIRPDIVGENLRKQLEK